MCGIAGLLSHVDFTEKNRLISEMTNVLRHRGPDGEGIYVDSWVALGHTRLSIVDPALGFQPMHYKGPEGHYSIVFNGEIFNHKALRKTLENEGYVLNTRCDTEVLLLLFVRYGASAIERLNGQWAFAIWDHGRRRLFLSRDRTGVRPLHYVSRKGEFAFGSEIKSLFKLPWVERSFDVETLDDILHFWAPLPGKTVFRHIKELPPGHSMWVDADGEQNIFQYWDIRFPEEKLAFTSVEKAVYELEKHLMEAVQLRLSADVPVGVYLSGGLDSSIIASLATQAVGTQVETFGIGFSHSAFDETRAQREVANHLGTKHHVVTCSPNDIVQAFARAVYHAERPLVRMAPTPMFLLARWVKDQGYKVVLTGEGADEFFAGYDIFRETLIRRFVAQRPDWGAAKKIYSHMYSYMPELENLPPDFLSGFFSKKNDDWNAPLFSHLPRIEMTRRIRGLIKPEYRLSEHSACQRLIRTLPYSFMRMSPLERSQYLEAKVLMPGYILSSQGDRMSMAHGVEGRFPFLDQNVVRFAMTLPSDLKILGLKEKWLLKKMGRRYLPSSIWARPKQPFRAPDGDILRQGRQVGEESLLSILAPERVEKANIFCPQSIDRLRSYALSSKRPLSTRDQMALCFAISTQILHETFIAS